ncbi:hypothetical protein GSI_09416 [Ganoderma sinense ZZ0214-1]|uniref:Uncharacterized protein n=1 Tax=Ganoderma sinense ZZ0214-1 TaxID=1077348 RepID=A0A2G8S6I8_9APHY|nr:hypothetical protein GSI_09416 [Ganoderma sinense ZZ0214-1]
MATAATAATTASPAEHAQRLPCITFITNDARFTPGDSNDPSKIVRIVVAELGHAEWGIVVSEVDDATAPDLMVLIDQTVWFEVDECLGRVRIARLSVIPGHGTWMNYEFIFPSRLDFADFVRCLFEAKSHILYHRFRMMESLSAVAAQQFQIAAATQSGNAAAEDTASGSDTSAEGIEDGNGASTLLPQLSPAVADPAPVFAQDG